MRSHLYCLLAICLFSTIEVSSKLIGGDINPGAIVAWRFLIGGTVILPAAIRQMAIHKVRLDIGSILRISALGILNVCISMLLLQWSVYWGRASITAIIVASNPLFVSVFAYFILKEKLGWFTVIGLILGFLGLLLIVFGELKLDEGVKSLEWGLVLALLTAISFGLYTVLAKKTISIYGSMLTNSISFIVGALLLMLVYLLLGQELLFSPSLTNISLILYLGLGVTGLAYMLYFEGMKQLQAAKASIYFFLKPAIAQVLAFFLLKEVLSVWQIAGLILIMLALGRNLFLRPKLKAVS